MSELEQARKMSQYELELKLDRMTQRAFPNTIQRAPRKQLTEVDAEIIKEYQKQFNEPVKEYEMEIDEETGEERIATYPDGKLKFKIVAKKYRVVPPPELDVVDSSQFYTIPTDEQVEDTYNELNRMKKYMDEKNIELKEFDKVRKQLIDYIDNLPKPSRLFKSSSTKPTGIKGLTAVSTRQQNLLFEEEQDKYEGDFNYLTKLLREGDEERKQIVEDLNEVTDLYNNLTSEYQKIDSYTSFNNAEVAKVKKINAVRVKEYQDTLNLMNKGAFQQDQMPNETEEDYVNRLQANAEEEVLVESKYEADMEIKRRFKQALKQLVRDDVIIEQVANKIPDEDIVVKSEILKKFPLFKKKFADLYGINNKSVEAIDINNFINAFTKSLEGDNSLLDYLKTEPIENEKPQEMEIDLTHLTHLTRLQLAEQDRKKVYIIEQPINKRRVYFRVALDADTEEFHLIWSFLGKRNTYREFIPSDNELTPREEAMDIVNSFEEIKNAIKMTKGFIQSKFNNRPYSDKWITFLLTKIQPTSSIDEIPAIYEPNYEFEGKDYPSVMGWGIKSDEIPELVDFGKLKLALNQLFYKNVLSVRHRNGNRIAGFANVKVSDDLVAIIMKLAKGERVIKQEVNGLKKTEQMLYDTLLSLANLHKTTPNNKDITITSMKERMGLIGGEIEAGNDNKALVKELYNIVKALKSFGVISNKEAIRYLSQF